MIVHYFYVIGVVIMPDEANPELIVNPDTVLSRPVPLEGFQAITGRTPQILQIFRSIQDQELSQGRPKQIMGNFSDRLPLKEPFRFPAPERFYHPVNL
jgi:hypothetical protein